MQMPDVNILVFAHREGTENHSTSAHWLTAMATGREPFAFSELVMHGFLRIVTNPRIFQPASSMDDALTFLEQFLNLPHCTRIRPGTLHWEIFQNLCRRTGVRGKLVADAAHAALAIESGCEWVTADTDFARFAPDLRWRHLL